jgi:hypothetical protein
LKGLHIAKENAMAFSDPQSVTISGSAITLPRTGSGLSTGAFSSGDGANAIDVRHSYGKTRIRRTIGISNKKFAADPLRPTDNKPVNATVRLVVDAPLQGYTPADLQAIIVGFLGNLTATSNANLVKLLGGES